MSMCRDLDFELIAVKVKFLMLSAVLSISQLRSQNLIMLFKQCLAFRDSNEFSWSKLKRSNLSRSKRACSLHTFSDRKVFSDLRHFIQLKSSASDFLIYSHPSLLTARLSSNPAMSDADMFCSRDTTLTSHVSICRMSFTYVSMFV